MQEKMTVEEIAKAISSLNSSQILALKNELCKVFDISPTALSTPVSSGPVAAAVVEEEQGAPKSYKLVLAIDEKEITEARKNDTVLKSQMLKLIRNHTGEGSSSSGMTLGKAIEVLNQLTAGTPIVLKTKLSTDRDQIAETIRKEVANFNFIQVKIEQE